jgi:hypothetical protein
LTPVCGEQSLREVSASQARNTPECRPSVGMTEQKVFLTVSIGMQARHPTPPVRL